MQFLPDSYRFQSIGGLTILTLALFIWSLREGLELNATLLTLVLPVIYTGGVGVFWFLLPASIFTRIPIVILYGFGVYALCLTANIYTVAAIRTIALLRAARGVGFVLTLLTFFLAFDTILSFRWPVYLNAASAFLVSSPLYLQGFWTVVLNKKLSRGLLLKAMISSLVMAEVAIALFFWPVTVVVGSLFMTVTAYILLGLGQAEIEGRMFSKTIREYLLVGLLVFLVMFAVTSWGG